MTVDRKRVGLVSLGCPKNLVDSEVMLGLVREAGHEVTTDPSEADVVVVNTCAFIDSAKQESIDVILEMAERKRAVGGRLIVAGCLAERYREKLREEIPEIDALVGTGAIPEIVRAVSATPPPPGPGMAAEQPVAFFHDAASAVTRGAGAVVAPAGPTYLYDADTPRMRSTPPHLAYVKIAEGCDYRCAFCIIPKLRGEYRSRPARSIIAEAEALAADGVKELILVSQDTTFYGIDRGERGALASLLRELDGVSGLKRIRLMYFYPTTVDEATLEAMASCEKVCKYVDLPLQHASDRVLRRMGRPGTRRSYERLLARIRRLVPGVALRTTFIVGFPGETEEDVDELERFIEASEFDHIGVFRYSHEEGTPAFSLPDDVPERVKRGRERRLMMLQRRIVRDAHRRRIGEAVEVMVDGPSAEHPLVIQGRLEGQAPEIDPVVYLDGVDPAALRGGDVVRGVIAGARGYDLVARAAAQPGERSLHESNDSTL
ncbi:MAG: 30S ribosomal protein S12 methylthiotransferase RimO [Vicinamibacterales bacterium]